MLEIKTELTARQTANELLYALQILTKKHHAINLGAAQLLSHVN